MAPNNNVMDDAVDDRLKQRRISRRELSCLLLNCRVCCGNSRERLDDDNQEQPPCDDDVHEMAAAAVGETQQQQQQQDMCCPLHPNVRGRNGRCPLCAAQSARELKRRNSSESVCRDDDGDNNSILSGGKSLHKMSSGKRSKSVPRNGPRDKSNEESQQQQQLSSSASLKQLRQMIEKAQQSVGRFTPDDDYDTYYTAADVYAGEEDFAYPTNTTTTNDNRYEEAGATDDEEEASSEEESISSMARNNEGKKNFAESKGFIFPVAVKEDKKKRMKTSPFKLKHPQQKLGERKISSMDNSLGTATANDSNTKNGLEPQYYQDLSSTRSSTWSSSDEEPICLFPGKKKMSTSDDNVSRTMSSSHSDSSVTLSSLLSKGSFGSSSESVKSTLLFNHSNEQEMEHNATDSPTSVLEDVASTDATNISDSS
eukprot:scaffold54839_cov21-Cyclotella_meneghiniana.AAC.1